jgi:B12-binding domain/radical SAM domain protein of rhizo-twelve system
MKYSLINPPWTFEGSIYFGCREPHLPLEYGYAKALLEEAGHEVQLLDGQLDGTPLSQMHEQLARFRPDFTVLTTAPSYLFWRCAPPELRVPMDAANALRDVTGKLIVVGPHASTTPQATLRKLGADACVLGECEETLPQLAGEWSRVDSLCFRDNGAVRVHGSPHACDMNRLPALHWPDESVRRHSHHHHRFEAPPQGPGAEMEVSRGCPYHCTFCAKDNFRNNFRRRPLPAIEAELDALIAQGIEYVYFIDEIFLPFKDVLHMLVTKHVRFGMQTRIDLWNEESIELLGRGGCVSIEAGVESITPEGRDLLDKKCKMSTDELTDRLIYARKHVPFVQANLLNSEFDEPAEVEAWRQRLEAAGVWANKPVPLFPYPGSPDYTRRWGAPDERAWERAHEFYLNSFTDFSDIQERQPEPLVILEAASNSSPEQRA